MRNIWFETQNQRWKNYLLLIGLMRLMLLQNIHTFHNEYAKNYQRVKDVNSPRFKYAQWVINDGCVYICKISGLDYYITCIVIEFILTHLNVKPIYFH